MTELEKKPICCAPSAGKTINIRILIDSTKCTGCGLCGELCPFGLPIPTNNGKFEIKKPELCTECSACQRNCPAQAIIMQERVGCGCLWDARKRLNDKKNSCNCC
ncbi:MAG: 4Fe-4S binding protein [Promethearchaeota archaeon]